MATTIGDAAEVINNLDYGWVFRIENLEVKRVPEMYAPNVYHDEDNDILIDGDDGWSAFTGLTNQYSYNGAVMHTSEYVGVAIARHLTEYPDQMFAIVLVEDMEDGESIGWAILYRDIPTA